MHILEWQIYIKFSKKSMNFLNCWDYKVEEVTGLEPMNIWFAIRCITNFAIPPARLNHFWSDKVKMILHMKVAESKGFEPSEAWTSPVFKTGPFDQLWQLSTTKKKMVRMVRIELTLRNRNGILSPARLPIPPHSHKQWNEI